MPATELGRLLRHWRDLRGQSQLDLSLDTGISQRHLSFVESGRSVPSREVLLKVARALDVPLRDRNPLLLAAGYAPVYAESGWDAAEMRTITAALRRMLRQHEPFPAVVLDRYWNVLMANEHTPRFFKLFIDLEARPKPRNFLHLMFDPAGMRPFIANWEEVASSLLERVRREAVGGVVDQRTRELLATVSAYPDTPPADKARRPANVLPVIPIRFVKDGEELSYFSMVATVGVPQAVAAQELRLDCLFPADDETEARHLALLEPTSAH
ncbi:MAG: helix-turn-helix transcriptional regulator [Rhodospirillales bacterium]|nr:helix-turn-helix transcriptional regulator [Acetobacter sp.]